MHVSDETIAHYLQQFPSVSNVSAVCFASVCVSVVFLSAPVMF